MEGMSEKMNKQPAAPTLPVFVEKKHHQRQQIDSTARRPPFLNVQHVNLWTVYNAFVCFACGVAYNFLMITSPPRQASWQYNLVSALVITMLWCSTPQAAFGALALLLPSNRWRLRRAAAYAALTITVASHCMLAAAVVVMVTTDPRYFFFLIVGGGAAMFMCAVWDLLSFLAILRGEWAH